MLDSLMARGQKKVGVGHEANNLALETMYVTKPKNGCRMDNFGK
jgi:hypothetical protein